MSRARSQKYDKGGRVSKIADFETTLFDDTQNEIGSGTLYTEGAKVGDAAQVVGNLGVDYRITKGVNVDVSMRYVDGLYADYSITGSDLWLHRICCFFRYGIVCHRWPHRS